MVRSIYKYYYMEVMIATVVNTWDQLLLQYSWGSQKQIHQHQPIQYKPSSCLLTWIPTKLDCCIRVVTLTAFTGANTYIVRVYFNFLQFLSYEHCHCAIHNFRIGASITVALAGWLLHVVRLLFGELRGLLHVIQLLFDATDLIAKLCTVAVHAT